MAADLPAPAVTLSLRTEAGSIQDAFLRRAAAALERIASQATSATLADALAAPTDVGSLARILSRSDAIGSAVGELDPLVPALARNMQHREQLLRRAGGTLSSGEVGHVLGISRQAVEKRRRTGTLLAVREGSDWRYPACQFDVGETAPGLADVLRGMAESGPWATLDFLVAPDAALGGRTPIQALWDRDRTEVVRLVPSAGGDGFA